MSKRTSAPLCSSLVLVFISALGTPPVAAADAPVLACLDPRGCPDLITDANLLNQWKIEKRTFSSTDCAVVEGEVGAGQRRLLRFTAGFPNVGPGDLVIGNPFDHPELYDFTTCHGHPHFKEYADYRLWTTQGYSDWRALRDGNPDAVPSEILGARPDLAAQMMAGRKEGFCAIDFTPYSSTAGPAKYTSCSTNQGISAGWEDVYSLRLDGQWIDITDVLPGTYVLEVETNAERLFEEADYANNSAAITVKIPSSKKKQ